MQAFKSVAVEEISVPGWLRNAAAEALHPPLCVLGLSAAQGWLFPSCQLLSASKEGIFLIFSTQGMNGCCQAEGRPIQMLPLHMFHMLETGKWRQRERENQDKILISWPGTPDTSLVIVPLPPASPAPFSSFGLSKCSLTKPGKGFFSPLEKGENADI